jgi:hypothetical protein
MVGSSLTGAAAIVMAAERHRQRTGAWPESIGAIAPDILSHPPIDPFSGQPYIFKRRDGRLIVYSIGSNGRDQHGAYDPKRRTIEGPDDVGATVWDVALRRRSAP